MSHTCCIGIFYTKGVIQCFLMGERRQRRLIVWAAYLWFELLIQTTLCQLQEERGNLLKIVPSRNRYVLKA